MKAACEGTRCGGGGPHSCVLTGFGFHLQGSESQQAGGGMAAGMGVFIEELLPESFLRHAFGRFFGMLAEAGPGAVPPELAAEADALRRQLATNLNLQFDLQDLEDEEDEDAPVVVDLQTA